MTKLLVFNLNIDNETQITTELEAAGACSVDGVEVTVGSFLQPELVDEMADYDAVILNMDASTDSEENLSMLLEAADNPLVSGQFVGKIASLHLNTCSSDIDPTQLEQNQVDYDAIKNKLSTMIESHGMMLVSAPESKDGMDDGENNAVRQGQYVAQMATWLK